ncbi:MAG: glycosyltransferase family 2 protein [Lachnospiraceae bacterium]|nr:glycosyltransferase family 2 protein [Lachnospiraceae bacterium]
MKYSIIIPVYNVEDYLNECINSVLSQTYKNIQVILVDDGSTDTSGLICDKYMREFKNIKAIHKVNGGLSSARNVGVKKACGDYIIFLDSDDYWMDNRALEEIDLYIEKERCNVLIWKSCKYYQAFKRFEKLQKETLLFKIIDSRKEILNNYEFKACAWDKAINREFYLNGDYEFQEGVLCEDVEWCFKMLLNTKNIVFFDKYVSIYRQRTGSITKSQAEKKTEDMISHLNSMLELFKKVETKEQILRENCASYIAEQYVNTIISGGNTAVLKENMNNLEQMKSILKYAKTKKTKMINRLVSYIGFENTCMICNKAFRLKNFFIV